MAKNLGAEFGTMDEDERREFGGKGLSGTGGQPQELDSFDDPRDYDHVGTHPQPESRERRAHERMEIAEAGGPLPDPPPKKRR
jgi:hypothetical protein